MLVRKGSCGTASRGARTGRIMIIRQKRRNDMAMEEKLPKRSEVPEELTWRLEDIYENTEAWEADLERCGALSEALSAREGSAAADAAGLLATMKLYASCMELLYKVYGYASMRHDEDTADAGRQKLYSRAQALEVRVSERAAFLEPEILALPEGTVERWMTELPELAAYRVTLHEIARQKAHTLDGASEKLLAAAGEMAQTPYNAFGMLQNADLRFPAAKDAEGKEVLISGGRFVPLEMSPDRALRRDVFEKFYGSYRDLIHTFAALYDGQVKQQGFYARARKYGSAFEAAVDRNNVSPAVCDRLIATVREEIGTMHRYVRLRRKLLGVDELHMYDVYAPMVKDVTWKVSFEEAKELSLKALAPLGKEYTDLLEKAYRERWVDVVENEGKRGGAYSSNVYGVHPYVLLNFNGTLDDVFTLVHEMGHSLHSWYSSKALNFLDSEYRIFVAEVASTTNEMLLLHYLLKENSEKLEAAGKGGALKKLKAERAYLINHLLESFKGTLFRQTMFEEFERKSNEMAEKGEPLTADALSELYLSLNRAYFGEDMVSDPLIAYEWARIPHFYYNFYVYQYATSFAAAVDISRRILEEGEAVTGPYREFLSSGCTKDPVSLLKIAGVDLSTGEPVSSALKEFEAAVAEMEALS